MTNAKASRLKQNTQIIISLALYEYQLMEFEKVVSLPKLAIHRESESGTREVVFVYLQFWGVPGLWRLYY